jgi:tetratricopeptide (TPR) repeat protein
LGWFATLIAVLVLCLLGFVFTYREYRRLEIQLAAAREGMRRQAWVEALAPLEVLATSLFYRADDEVNYRLGLCQWKLGRRAAAVPALSRVRAGSDFAIDAGIVLAEDELQSGELRAAEERLLGLLLPGRPSPKPVLMALVRLVRLEGRYDEARAWIRAAFDRADEPVGLLRQLWLLDRGVVPIDGVRANLQQWLTRSPDDDRVWLGLGRVAILEGRLDESEKWLRRALHRRPGDRALLRAWLDWARAAGRPREVERLLSGPLMAELEPGERLVHRAWLARCRGDVEDERLSLECWLEREPQNPVVLERLGTLAAQAGDSSRALALRRRKERVDDALDRYGRRMKAPGEFAAVADRVAMARLAELAGRPFDARAWCKLASRIEPGNLEVAVLLARLDQAAALHDCERAASHAARPPGSGDEPADGRQELRPANVEFRDDAPTAGLGFHLDNGLTPIRQIPAVMSGGVGLLDYDDDGWLDVFCVQGGAFPPGQERPSGGDRLFRNRRDGTFQDVTLPSGIAGFPAGYGNGVAVGDYDNDGRADLFITRWRAYALYRNRGDGTFQDATLAAGLGGERDWPTSAAFADLDGDGDLDLYVCHYLTWDCDNPKLCRDSETGAYASCSPLQFAARPDHVFRNDGGRFIDVTSSAGIVDQDGRGLGVIAADLDGDGKIDLFVTNDQSANYLFHNVGGFRFEEVGHLAGVAGNAAGGYQAGMGIACGDFDGDGQPDLAVTNFYGESTTLYRNLGAGLFGDGTAASGLSVSSRYLLGFGAAFLDADNDGHLDLLTANGHLDPLPGIPYTMPVQLLMGDGARLRDVTLTAGSALGVPRIGRGLAVGDLDNDGRLDAVLVDQQGPTAYLHNRTTGGGHFIVLKLEGTRSGREAVGARVVVSSGGRRLSAWRLGGGSYLSASDSRLHLGLGPPGRIESLEVFWPSGLIQRFADVAADRGYRIREGERELHLLPEISR